jgi:hypothetical protein
MTEELRAAFEADYSVDGWFPKLIERDAAGMYVLSGAAMAWKYWQLGAAAERASTAAWLDCDWPEDGAYDREDRARLAKALLAPVDPS